MKNIRKAPKRESLLMLVYMLCVCLICGPSFYHKYFDTEKKNGREGIEDVEEAAAYMSASVTEEAPRIAITFDDGPSGTYTPMLLDGLKERGVKGTFFLIGENVEKYPEVVKRLDEEGHLIGNHTYHHVEITKVSDEEAYKEIVDTNRVIYEITGKATEYMRPPFGAWQRNLELKLSVLPVMWTIDPLDWTTENTDEIVNKVVTEAEENDIILLHDCYKSSVEAALRIVDILQKEGFEFVTVDELIMY
ncbi:MAG: polysaccharide deacetylase family protein [Eubacteriales bacterium]|nr:polysaccharide deacetylase family protein [Eubacteriales bacterium]